MHCRCSMTPHPTRHGASAMHAIWCRHAILYIPKHTNPLVCHIRCCMLSCSCQPGAWLSVKPHQPSPKLLVPRYCSPGHSTAAPYHAPPSGHCNAQWAPGWSGGDAGASSGCHTREHSSSEVHPEGEQGLLSKKGPAAAATTAMGFGLCFFATKLLDVHRSRASTVRRSGGVVWTVSVLSR